MTPKDKLEIGLKEDEKARTDTNVVPETEEVPADAEAIPQPPTPAAERRSPQPPIEPRT